jgi:hypothetical protein
MSISIKYDNIVIECVCRHKHLKHMKYVVTYCITKDARWPWLTQWKANWWKNTGWLELSLTWLLASWSSSMSWRFPSMLCSTSPVGIFYYDTYYISTAFCTVWVRAQAVPWVRECVCVCVCLCSLGSKVVISLSWLPLNVSNCTLLCSSWLSSVYSIFSPSSVCLHTRIKSWLFIEGLSPQLKWPPWLLTAAALPCLFTNVWIQLFMLDFKKSWPTL